ncbi:metallophosphoesterase [Litorimonas cladophorae]|uniref:metallophosphoesterase n=1 Tax=Litorimonas cladophorae TaxID=1220491 RepID=UPI001673B77F|nr:metallophosphoesterase [Litorimonas cladophorae]
MHSLISKNESGRDFAVGDIHGHIDLLMEELSYVGFDPSRDRVFSVGDLIDRGPKSLDCLKLLDEPWFYAVRGNHEQMMIDWFSCDAFPSWIRNYGTWTQELQRTEIAAWVERLMSLPIAITLKGETSTVGICHAEPCGHDWATMIDDLTCHQQMMWGRKVLRGDVDPRPVIGVDITLHGHTPVPKMRRIGNRYFLDTGAGDGDKLTVMNIATLVQGYRDFAALA